MSSPPMQVTELKKALVAAGFEVYRTRGQIVHLADRVRDNLIMDAAVAVATGPALRVLFVARSQKSDFPGESAENLYHRARVLSVTALARGYCETGVTESSVTDPADPTRTLDTFYEVSFERSVSSWEEALEEVRFAIGLEKATRTNL